MGDFPIEWSWVRDLPAGGQGYTYVVRPAGVPDPELYVLKRLKNPKRKDYFEREIKACMTLNHPNVLKLITHGETPKGTPFLITEYCAEGSLSDRKTFRFDDPGKGLRFFAGIVAGVAHAHAHVKPIYHLDLKPANILLKGNTPVVGDFGICFIEDNELNMTSDGPRGSIYYCAPELRGPKIDGTPSLAAADVYSLGKVLYWLFTGEVYDGHEDDYGDAPNRKLAHLFPASPQFAFIDELVAQMVRRNPAQRIATANALCDRLQEVVRRIETGGHVLDLKVPQRCLYCGAGHYRPAHDAIHVAGLPQFNQKFPEIEKRRVPDNPSYPESSIYATLRSVARTIFGGTNLSPGIPLFLVCDFCGNIQYFRLDLTADGRGDNWRP